MSSFLIATSDLRQIAYILDVNISNDFRNEEEIVEECFETAYCACKERKWEKIDSIINQLSSLINRAGFSLLIMSILKNDSEVFAALIEKKIALLSFDKLGNSPADYLFDGKNSTSFQSKHVIKLGNRYRELKQLNAALKCFVVAQFIASRAGSIKGLGAVYVDIGTVLVLLESSLAQAVMFFDMAILILGDLYPKIQSRAYHLLGSIYKDLGRTEAYIENYEKYFFFLELRREKLTHQENPSQLMSFFLEAQARNHFAYDYMVLKKDKLAFKHLQIACRLLLLLEEEDALEEKAINSIQFGQLYSNAGEYEESSRLYAVGFDHAERCLNLEYMASALAGIGDNLRHIGDFDEALLYYDKSLNLLQNIKNPTKIQLNIMSMTYSGQALAFMGKEKLVDVIDSYKSAFKISSAIDDIYGVARAYLNLGAACLHLNQTEVAIPLLKSAAVVYSLIQEKLYSQPEWKITIFELHVRALYGLEDAFFCQEKHVEALQMFDSRRANVLTELITFRQAFSDRKSILEKTITIEEIQQLADRQKTTFLIYSMSPLIGQLIVWVISSNAKPHHQILSMDLLLKDIRGFKTFKEGFPFCQLKTNEEGARSSEVEIPILEEFAEVMRGGPSQREKALERLRNRFAIKLTQWYDTLITPIESFLPQDSTTTITIVPDGILEQLPFAIMRDANKKYFVEKHPILIAPSIKTLQLLEIVASERPLVQENQALIIGNPNTVNHSPLPLGEIEAENVADLLHAGQDFILIQSEATVSRFIEQAPQARWIFAACHGEANIEPESSLDSVFAGDLKLTPDKHYPKGCLHSQQISALKLQAELVFLSACYSGTGKMLREGMIGNVWSFLAAGALSVIGSYFLVSETEETGDFVLCFYRHLLGVEGTPKLNKAQALREAMLKAIKKNRDHFEKWGAFYLSGLNTLNNTIPVEGSLQERVAASSSTTIYTDESSVSSLEKAIVLLEKKSREHMDDAKIHELVIELQLMKQEIENSLIAAGLKTSFLDRISIVNRLLPASSRKEHDIF